jgi:EcsC protein family
VTRGPGGQDAGAVLFTPAHHDELTRAVGALENPNLAARLAEYGGAPVNRVLDLLPGVVDAALSRAVELAMMRCLKTAIRTLDGTAQRRPPAWLNSMAAGVTGGVGGFVGLAALPVELPVTTTLMLRAIADVARANEEDLSHIEARLACLEVFALGARPTGARSDVGYLASRPVLGQIAGDAAAFLVERGAVDLSSPLISRFTTELVSRFSLVVSDRVAVSALPILGSLGGATVNMIFMHHFQRVARGHFTVRRLERLYGVEVVRRHYDVVASRMQSVR